MSSLGRRILLAVSLFVLVFVGFSIYANASAVQERLSHFAWWTFGAAIGFTMLNYAVRFIRWQNYLRIAQIDVPTGDSLNIFLSGFVMSITPGKVGEVLKSFLLKETYQVPIARSAPIVIAERLTDLVAVILIASLGVSVYHYGASVIFIATGMVGIGLGILSSRRLSIRMLHLLAKVPGLGRIAHKVEEFYDSLAVMIRPWPLIWGTGLSVLAWLCECMGFWLILRGFGPTEIPKAWAAFIYCTTTLAGAISFLPGGLLVSEVSMAALLLRGATGFDKATAAAATFLVRLATLWFGVVVGLCALSLRRRRAQP